MREGPELTESQKPSYKYPLGLGQFLMSGCHDFIVNSKEASSLSFVTPNEDSGDLQSDIDIEPEDDTDRKKRDLKKSSFINQTDFRIFCRRFAQLKKNRDCNVRITNFITFDYNSKFDNFDTENDSRCLYARCWLRYKI